MSSTKDYTDLIISELELRRKRELSSKEPNSKYKVIAYTKAIDEIKHFNKVITSYDDVKHLPGIGKSIGNKIKQIIETGELSEEGYFQNNSIEELMTIHGIGPVKARELLKLGIGSVEQLSKAVDKNPFLLNDVQKLGLKYFTYSLERIPRAEMKQHEKILLGFMPEGLTGEIAGSYRRKAKDSGDIDMLITYNSNTSEKDAESLFELFVVELFENGYILDTLASGKKKWMGYVSKGPRSKPRRLDILLTSPKEYPYALLYFTGSDKFNVALRKYVNTKGYTINEHEMIPLKTLESSTEKIEIPPIMEKEKDIFTFLGLEYVKPENRINYEKIIPKFNK